MSALPLPAAPPGAGDDADTDTESPSSPSSHSRSLSQRSRERSAPSSPSREQPQSPTSAASSPPSPSSPLAGQSEDEVEGAPMTAGAALLTHPPSVLPSTSPVPSFTLPARSLALVTPSTSAPPHYLWRIDHFPHLRASHTDRHYSSEFTLDGQTWRMLLFPCGNRQVQHYSDALSLYVQLAGPRLETPPVYQHHFSFTAVPPAHPPSSPYAHVSPFTKESTHRFTNEDNDRGFNPWLDAKELPAFLHPPLSTLVIRVEMQRQKMAALQWTDSAYDSKLATGFVGLRNQGATCQPTAHTHSDIGRRH